MATYSRENNAYTKLREEDTTPLTPAPTPQTYTGGYTIGYSSGYNRRRIV